MLMMFFFRMTQLTRARVLTDDKDNEISTVRVSQTAWFTEANEPLIGQLNRRIESITGLSVNMNKSDCELVQIANYGIGGHYVPHYDYLIKDKPENQRTNISEKDQYAGDRIATFMFYVCVCITYIIIIDYFFCSFVCTVFRK